MEIKFGPGTAGLAQRIGSRYSLDISGTEFTGSQRFALNKNYIMPCGQNQY